MIDFDEEEQVSRMKGGNSWEGGGKVSLRGGRGDASRLWRVGWVGGGWMPTLCASCLPTCVAHRKPFLPVTLGDNLLDSRVTWIFDQGMLFYTFYVFADDHFPYVHIDPH